MLDMTVQGRELTKGRAFQVWEYQVSLGQLLVRSPGSTATGDEAERRTNVDLTFFGVEYMALPRHLGDIEVSSSTKDEARELEALLGKPLSAEKLHILISKGRRFPVVAESLTISENEWDIFDSPFEFRSQFRGAGREGSEESSP
jgi:hypothetical protein